MVYITYPMYYTKNIYIWRSGLETCFRTDCLPSNYHTLKQKVYFILWWGLKTLSHIISQTMSPQIFLFDSHTWKHDSRETVVTAIIKCISKMYFLIPGPAWKCFVVYNISHKHTANILFDSQAWKHYSLKIIGYNNINLMYKYYTLEWKYFCFMLGLNTFCNFYYQANKFDVQA